MSFTVISCCIPTGQITYLCFRWDATSPHVPNPFFIQESCFGGKNISEISNYCQISLCDHFHQPWCYTTNSSERWQTCSIPLCEGAVLFIRLENWYRLTFTLTIFSVNDLKVRQARNVFHGPSVQCIMARQTPPSRVIPASGSRLTLHSNVCFLQSKWVVS